MVIKVPKTAFVQPHDCGLLAARLGRLEELARRESWLREADSDVEDSDVEDSDGGRVEQSAGMARSAVFSLFILFCGSLEL